MQQVTLKNFNFKTVNKIKQVIENKHRKFSQNFSWVQVKSEDLFDIK